MHRNTDLTQVLKFAILLMLQSISKSAKIILTDKLEFDKVISLKQIIEYIKQKYNPLSIILYGSYANGTNNLNSDFDALVISSDYKQYHDTSFINGVQLDVFVYPASYFDEDYNCEDFVQIYDGKIIADNNGIGRGLQTRVQTYVQNRPHKSNTEIQANIDWCLKMFERAKRNDAEGMFRWHWVLIDSLEIFCDIMHHPYWGPKKSLKWMVEQHPIAYDIYQKALMNFNVTDLENWILYLKNKKG